MAGRVPGHERGDPGGIAALVGLIDQHRAAFDYEWRTKFASAVEEIGSRAMPWGEAYRLAGVLLSDPSTFVAAANAGWPHPMSLEGIVLLDLFDLSHVWANQGKRQKPHHLRPKAKRSTEVRGRKQVLTQEEIFAVLRKAGHDISPSGQLNMSR